MNTNMPALARRDFLHHSALATAAAALSWSASARGEEKPRRVRVGQIGTSHDHAGGKMDALRRLGDDYEVVGVVEPDPVRRRIAQNSALYRGLTWMTEEQLLHTQGLQAVAVETEVSELVPTARRAVAAGMHVHMDKPAGENLTEYRRLLDEATSKHRCVQMGYMFRTNPAFRLCFQLVRQGWLGKVFEVQGLMAKQIVDEERKRNLRYRGGMMFQLGCHLIDAMVRVLGRPSKVAAYGRAVCQEKDSLPDNQLAVFEYPAALATVRVSVTEVEGMHRRQFVVCGTEGSVEIRPLEPAVMHLSLDRPRDKYVRGRQEVTLPKMSARYDDQFRELARIARGEAQAEYSPEHDLLVQELTLRASGMES